MEENINKIISKLTNILSQINPNEFMNQINNSKESKEYVEISKKFCEIITSVKAQILFDIPDELSSLIKKDKLINETNNSIIINNNEGKNNNKINDFNIKSILAQFKLKLFNLNSNISELNINLNNISSNLKKHKYSLASKRIENLIKLKEKMSINLTFLEGIKNNLSENADFFNNKNVHDFNKKKIIQLTKTPSPNRFRKSIKNLPSISLNGKNVNNKKNLSRNNMLNINIKTFKTIETKRKNTLNSSSISTTPTKPRKIKFKKFGNINTKTEIKNNNCNSSTKDKEKDELIKKLKIEIESLNQKYNNLINKEKNSSSKLNLEKDALLFFNDKLRKISDFIFSITFLISNLQKKYSQMSSEKELIDINNNLMQITSEVSEIKTYILKMSIENKNIFIIESQNKENEDISKDFDISLCKTRIKSLQSENQNLKSLIEELNIKISTLNEMKSSSKSENSEICSLKEKLNQSEKKIIEMKNVYEADLNSKTLIENLLQKNLEEQKVYYEEKISKLNKKLEEINKESKIFSSSDNREEPLKIFKNDDIFSLKEINSSFANEINSIKNIMNSNNDSNKLKNEITELNEKLSKKDKEIICLITNNNKDKKNLIEKYEKEKEELNKEINLLKIQIDKNKEKEKDKYENGGEIQIKSNQAQKIKNNFKDVVKVNEIVINLEKKLISISTNEKEGKNNISDDEEDDEDTDEEFIIKIKKLNETKINDNYEMKSYKKENRKLIHRYEDALDENHELKKKMILIEEIVINKQNELYNNLKKGFKDLLLFLSINNKSKGKIIYFLNLIQFSEQEIKLIIGKKK